MSNVFNLDSLREEVEKEFAPVKFELNDGTLVVLRNLLRMPKAARDSVLDLVEKFNEEDADTDGIASEILELVAETPAKGAKLVSEIGDDMALTLKVFRAWMETSQLGEVGNSPT